MSDNVTTETSAAEPTKKTIAFVWYAGATALDMVGPIQTLSALSFVDPAYEVVVVGASKTPMPSDCSVTIVPTHTFDELPQPWAVFVPGGMDATYLAMADETLLAWLREATATAEVFGSICTGSLILAAAGLLEGRRATSHWALRDRLAAFGAIPVAERWVEDGNVITAAGVSAGIDMALFLAQRLAGEEAARFIQFGIEYDPAPPLGALDWDAFDAEGMVKGAQAHAAGVLAAHPSLAEALSPS